jgi:hypothetical protein
LHALTLTDLDCWFVVDCSSSHAFLDLSGHGQECLFDVGCILGGRLEERDPKTVGEFLLQSQTVQVCFWSSYLRHRVLNDLLVCHIALVADQQLVDALGSIAVDLL